MTRFSGCIEPWSLSNHHVSALCRGTADNRSLFFPLLDQQIPQVHERTWHWQACQRRYAKPKNHDVTWRCVRWGVQSTCFRCSCAWEPEVEMMTFRTSCKIQLLTQLFSAGVRKGPKIYYIGFVEAVVFLLRTAHPQDETGLSEVRMHHCFQMTSSIL